MTVLHRPSSLEQVRDPLYVRDITEQYNHKRQQKLVDFEYLTFVSVCTGLCFGAGLGITLFGISYMFIHDGLVHKRFPVGPIADVPYLKRVAIAHKLHHSEKYGGVPWGLFLGPHVRIEPLPCTECPT